MMEEVNPNMSAVLQRQKKNVIKKVERGVAMGIVLMFTMTKKARIGIRSEKQKRTFEIGNCGATNNNSQMSVDSEVSTSVGRPETHSKNEGRYSI